MGEAKRFIGTVSAEDLARTRAGGEEEAGAVLRSGDQEDPLALIALAAREALVISNELRGIGVLRARLRRASVDPDYLGL